jgi:threonine aldolase
MIPRLREDHENARYLAERLAAVPGLGVDLSTVQSNIVNVDVRALGIDAATFVAGLHARGVRGLPGMGTNVRFVTYRGITRADVEQAADAVAALVASHPWAAD